MATSHTQTMSREEGRRRHHGFEGTSVRPSGETLRITARS
jgi:hypothetical protein